MDNKGLDQESPRRNRTGGNPEHRSPRWAKICLIVAVLFMGAGFVLPLLQSEQSRPAETAPAVDGLGANSLTGARSAEPLPETTDDAGRKRSALFRLGFSFAAAFAVAFAMRKFFNFTLASLSMFLAALFGLQFAGIIEVRWVAFEGGDYDGMVDWLKSQFDSFNSFIKGALPSGTAAAAGLFAGWRRKG